MGGGGWAGCHRVPRGARNREREEMRKFKNRRDSDNGVCVCVAAGARLDGLHIRYNALRATLCHDLLPPFLRVGKQPRKWQPKEVV